MRIGFLAFFCICSLSLIAQQEVIDKVISVVGDEIILLSDVEEQHALMQAQNGVLPDDARCTILDQILGQKLLLNQAKLDSILVDDEEVEVQLNARIDRILGYMQNDMKQFEEYYGQSIVDVKNQFREDLKAQILTDRMRSQIMTNIGVTPAEVKDFFAEIPYDSLPYFNSEVELSEIVHLPEVNKVERQKALDQLTELRRQIEEDGVDFAELASKYSDDPGSGRSGGDLGWTTRGQFVPEFEAAAYNLEIDELSELVESQFGIHLIQLLGRRGNTIHTRHILIKPEITDNDLLLAQAQLDSVRMLVQNDTLSFQEAVKRYSNEDTQSYSNSGQVVNPATGNTFFEIGDLEPDIYFAIDTMAVNGISAPFEFTAPTGETAYRLLLLQSRSEPHRASLQQDYSKIRDAAIESKKSDFIKNWLDDKIANTYIRIDESTYGSCPIVERWQTLNTNK